MRGVAGVNCLRFSRVSRALGVGLLLGSWLVSLLVERLLVWGKGIPLLGPCLASRKNYLLLRFNVN